jgi:Leucine-rich repeat (LRR) protein
LGLDKRIDVQVLTASISQVKTLKLIEKNIANITAIKDFTALTTLVVAENITTLSFSGNQLTSLDVSNSKALDRLKCYSNQLTSLDERNRNNT